jgi:hypothetical protein
LQLKPAEILALTPREFNILLMAQRERQLDEYERMADKAMMHEIAHRAKRPKRSDLFKRPSSDEIELQKLEEMAEQAKHATEWLSQFQIK